MGNGQWAMGNGQWAMGNGQWAMGIGQGQKSEVVETRRVKSEVTSDLPWRAVRPVASLQKS
ncbi:MAG: hypothetical protein ACRC2R_25310 [Xenococcaceae cyanobacterium]